jgi:hypothetical protein
MSLSNPWARTSSASVAPCGLLASSFSSSSVRWGCGLRRRFRTVVIHSVSAASYVLSIGWRAVGLLLRHGGTETEAEAPALREGNSGAGAGATRGTLDNLTLESNAVHIGAFPAESDQPSNALRPAAVILTRTTSIALPPAITTSRSAAASPRWLRLASTRG